MIPRTLQSAPVGARGIDTVAPIDAVHAAALRAAEMDFAVRYLGSVTSQEIDAILTAGLAFIPVTYANHLDSVQAVAALHALWLPAGATVFLDVENDAAMDPASLSAKINAWADAVRIAGFEPGLYVAAGCPLTSAELYALHVVRYWKGGSRIVDRHGQLAEPACGWCMLQLVPSVPRGDPPLLVDVDVLLEDFRGRVVHWTRAA
jgi:hypothetical protein